ncbi:MAG: endonuclease/exonuclease/phosphatase family protein [Gammaproteobacteria bacterium]|nr:endonuclease/exonuclease/phosphatase family protein [Gammaproteobacteria bacterium]MCP5425606.1 endonuclease/exonuclease/phosphatase family protein [Gammaproteobacteria bacterium]MCP5458994.1 endonuclease/exonuclease/phosphatase family protein [Gammaproteobacteria bacterium]
MLTLATFNLCNLGIDASDERYSRLAGHITRDLDAPNIIAVQEIKAVVDATERGPVPADAVYRRLIKAIIEQGGPQYSYCEIPPLAQQDGGQAGFNIRVGLLFDQQSVAFHERGRGGPQDATTVEIGEGPPRLSLNPGRIEPRHPAFTGDLTHHWAPARKALAVEFRVAGKPLFVIVCHLKSMRASNRREREYTKKQRHTQATVIHEFVQRLLDRDPDGYVVVLGDMNDSTGSKTLELLQGRSLRNLLEKIPKKKRYSFRAGGRGLTLDHVLVSRSLWLKGVARIPHVNSDVPMEEQASDHDPVWAGLPIHRSPTEYNALEGRDEVG